MKNSKTKPAQKTAPAAATVTENVTVTKTEKPAAVKTLAIRPNRLTAEKTLDTSKSEFGNRKIIYRGVTVIDEKTLAVTATDAVNSKPFDRETAEKIMAAAEKRSDVLTARTWYKRPAIVDGKTVEMRGVYIALKSDNGIAA